RPLEALAGERRRPPRLLPHRGVEVLVDRARVELRDPVGFAAKLALGLVLRERAEELDRDRGRDERRHEDTAEEDQRQTDAQRREHAWKGRAAARTNRAR